MDFNLIADIAGCAGFVLSCVIALSGWLKNRESFAINVIDYADFGGSTRFLLSIENRSRAPLAIREISFCGATCELEPKKIRGNPVSWNGVVSARFPLRIRCRDVDFAYIEFLDCQHTPLNQGTTVTCQIQTIPHSVSKSVILGRKAHYLNRRFRPQ